MTDADLVTLVLLQREALAGDYQAFSVARDMQREQCIPLLTPAEEVGLDEVRARPVLRRSSAIRAALARRVTQGEMTVVERLEFNSLLHTYQGGECFAHPFRRAAGSPYMISCSCWNPQRSRRRDMQIALSAEGVWRHRQKAPLFSGEVVSTTVFRPEKIIVVEQIETTFVRGKESIAQQIVVSPAEDIILASFFFGAENAFPAVFGGLNCTAFAANSLGGGIRYPTMLPGVPTTANFQVLPSALSRLATPKGFKPRNTTITVHMSLFGGALDTARKSSDPHRTMAILRWADPYTTSLGAGIQW